MFPLPVIVLYSDSDGALFDMLHFPFARRGPTKAKVPMIITVPVIPA
jgi:hypothetical protein